MPGDQLPTPHLLPTQPPPQMAVHNSAVMSAAVPSFVPAFHDDPIELQLQELRLRQQQHEPRQKKLPKKPIRHLETGDAEPSAVASEAGAPIKKCDKSKLTKHLKNSTVLKPAAAADISHTVEPSAAAPGAVASMKMSGRSNAQNSSKSLSGVPASAADANIGLEAPSTTVATCSSPKAIQSSREKQYKVQALATESNWAVGAVCMAKYAADGKFYAAEVVHVVGNNVTVSFTEYEGEFQTCHEKNLRPIVSKSGARGRSTKIVVATTTAHCAALEHGVSVGNQPKPSVPREAQVQSKHHFRSEVSVTLSSAAAQPLLSQHQKPLVYGKLERDSKTASLPASVEAMRPLSKKSTAKQMPEHAQEWEKALAAGDSHRLATDPDSSAVSLSSVGLVIPESTVGVPVKSSTASHAAIQATKPLTAFDLAKIRADERAAQQLQQASHLPEG